MESETAPQSKNNPVHDIKIEKMQCLTCNHFSLSECYVMQKVELNVSEEELKHFAVEIAFSEIKAFLKEFDSIKLEYLILKMAANVTVCNLDPELEKQVVFSS